MPNIRARAKRIISKLFPRRSIKRRASALTNDTSSMTPFATANFNDSNDSHHAVSFPALSSASAATEDSEEPAAAAAFQALMSAIESAARILQYEKMQKHREVEELKSEVSHYKEGVTVYKDELIQAQQEIKELKIMVEMLQEGY